MGDKRAAVPQLQLQYNTRYWSMAAKNWIKYTPCLKKLSKFVFVRTLSNSTNFGAFWQRDGKEA